MIKSTLIILTFFTLLAWVFPLNQKPINSIPQVTVEDSLVKEIWVRDSLIYELKGQMKNEAMQIATYKACCFQRIEKGK